MEYVEAWHYLIAIAILSFVIEIFTIGFIAGSAGIGFLLAALGNYWGLSLETQIFLFSGGLAFSFFTIKPIMVKLIYNKDAEKTNVEAMIGKEGRVLEEINANKGTGRVKIDGDDWKAITENNLLIPKGEMVRIIRLESIVLVVEKI